jgi:hypothetical protein
MHWPDVRTYLRWVNPQRALFRSFAKKHVDWAKARAGMGMRPVSRRRTHATVTVVTDDQSQIEEVVKTFFAAFTSGSDIEARLDGLRKVLLPEARIVRTCGVPASYDVDGFIDPRRELLTSGRVTEFREWELDGTTEVYGDIAHHWCTYAKEWMENGEPLTGAGAKAIQLVRTVTGWRISAVAWDDER